ncbi:MAG: YccF domain-containing protein [Lachnospiraceae bacterium]|nr:YccF domain-containing protein [Lachnospiraceae bacterium]MDE7028879.1 YccF domain-containing protein [Lachnospiraceae bacterium]
MSCLGNLLWFLFGGCISGLSWMLAGCLWCISIIGIPYGIQCFKFASVSFFPFGKEIVYGGGAVSFLVNVIWILISGIPLAIEHITIGCVLCVTLIGIPFGLQQFKLAKLALMPFGTRIVYTNQL